MPKHYSLKISDEFIEDLAAIYSANVLDEIKKTLELLAMMPEIGSRNTRFSLEERFGPGIRKIPVSKFVIIYRFVEDEVRVLALVYGPTIR